ncbi:MAG: methionyl-tRNA formyltransferase, partial [Clostridia bacterium]|nr:methionyl-tRNA formyltransferase [Clostridia bacterium]
MRVVFMGTPEFALPSLKTLIDMDLTVVGVFTQPDRPSGRGHKLESPPVKRLAQEHGIPVFQFERIRKQEGLDALRALKPDLVVTAAFGQILSKKILEVPRLGTINV